MATCVCLKGLRAFTRTLHTAMNTFSQLMKILDNPEIQQKEPFILAFHQQHHIRSDPQALRQLITLSKERNLQTYPLYHRLVLHYLETVQLEQAKKLIHEARAEGQIFELNEWKPMIKRLTANERQRFHFHQVFAEDSTNLKTITAYNAALNAAQQHGEVDTIKTLVGEMTKKDIKPTTASYEVMMNTALVQRKPTIALNINAESRKAGVALTKQSITALFRVLASTDKIKDASRTFKAFLDSGRTPHTEMLESILFLYEKRRNLTSAKNLWAAYFHRDQKGHYNVLTPSSYAFERMLRVCAVAAEFVPQESLEIATQIYNEYLDFAPIREKERGILEFLFVLANAAHPDSITFFQDNFDGLPRDRQALAITKMLGAAAKSSREDVADLVLDTQQKFQLKPNAADHFHLATLYGKGDDVSKAVFHVEMFTTLEKQESKGKHGYAIRRLRIKKVPHNHWQLLRHKLVEMKQESLLQRLDAAHPPKKLKKLKKSKKSSS